MSTRFVKFFDLFSDWLNRRRTASIDEITDGVDRWAAGDLTNRIDVAEKGQLANLATSLNRLADTIEAQSQRVDEEREKLRQIAERETAEAIRLAEVRRDLVANVSHEFKTPLTAIRAYAETLNDGALEDDQVAPRFVGRILEQCGRLEELLRDLLTLSRLEQVDRSPDAETLDLTALARQAIEVLAPRAQQRDIELRLTAAGEPRIVGARSEAENLLLNLVENAVKYNRQGGQVGIRIATQGSEVIIEVTDTGIGIPEGMIERIFERFYRVDKGRARDQGGTGLGLAIVKHAVRTLGGQIGVESRLGEGSVFRVKLPAADRDPAEYLPTNTTDAR